MSCVAGRDGLLPRTTRTTFISCGASQSVMSLSQRSLEEGCHQDSCVLLQGFSESLHSRGSHWGAQSMALLLRATNHRACSAAGICLGWAGRRSWKAAVCKLEALLRAPPLRPSPPDRPRHGSHVLFPSFILPCKQICSSHTFSASPTIRGMLLGATF